MYGRQSLCAIPRTKTRFRFGVGEHSCLVRTSADPVFTGMVKCSVFKLRISFGRLPWSKGTVRALLMHLISLFRIGDLPTMRSNRTMTSSSTYAEQVEKQETLKAKFNRRAIHLKGRGLANIRRHR